MKTLKYILSAIVLLTTVWGCEDNSFDNLDFVESAVAPTNVSALFGVTQDNTGSVTITPNSEGAVSYSVQYGDDTAEAETVSQGESTTHIYAEGSYNVVIKAIGITGLSTEITLPLEVSFKAPENLEVTIVNDEAVSKQVNVTATADYAVSFDVYFGEEGNDDPVSGNIGETVSYVYTEPGTYTIRVVAKGGAIETTEYSQEFEAVAIVQPIASATTPPMRNANDVISVYSSKYTDISGVDFNPDWGQSGQGSSYAEFDLNGDTMLQYINLSYQGIQFAAAEDLTEMEYLHMDVWTADVTTIETSLISLTNGEKPVVSELTADQWTSIDIPISAFTDQGLTVADIHQLKFVGDPWAGGTVFIDNLYFYRASTSEVSGSLPIDFESDYVFSSFDGGSIATVENPDTSGNTSANVAELIKGDGQTWAGSKITVEEPYDISENTVVTMKVWSPRVGLNVLMKFEDEAVWPDTSATSEITATTTVANAWEELSFTITGVDSSLYYYNLVLIMDNGTVGNGSSDYTIYVDDISIAPFLDFEENYAMSSFDGGSISAVENPDTTGNTSTTVAQLVKGAGQTWAGSKITVKEPFDIEEGTTIKIKVWSPRAGLNLLMKFEDAAAWPDTAATDEITVATTVANSWEELTYNITGVDSNIDYYNLVLIMDNGTMGDGTDNYTIYVDDISQN